MAGRRAVGTGAEAVGSLGRADASYASTSAISITSPRSIDNSAAALRRSGESKAQDKAATAVVLTALGKLVREHAEAVYNLVAQGRGDAQLLGRWKAQGMEKFDAVQVADAIQEGLDIHDLALESPTFRIRHRFALAKLILGDDATQDDLDDIERELSANIKAEDTDRATLNAEELVMDEVDAEEALPSRALPPEPPRRSRQMFRSPVRGR